MSIQKDIQKMANEARAAARALARTTTDQKNAALRAAADEIENDDASIREANERDLDEAKRAGLPPALIDRLALTAQRIEGMVAALRQVAELPDPVGEVFDGFTRANGLEISKVRVPIGVIAFIYESRPDVTAEASALCLKAGNATILRGGKEALRSDLAVRSSIAQGLAAAELPSASISMVETSDRAAVGALLEAEGLIDLVIPRGGEGLIRRVARESRVPVIKHYKGVCHTYVDGAADREMARAIVLNAKTQRPGVCNAMETLLLDAALENEFVAALLAELAAAGVEIRACERTRAAYPDAAAATDDDWLAEYLDLTLAVRTVDGVAAAIDHIATYGSAHSDAILTEDAGVAERFLAEVDSAAVYHNASTRFTDGGEFGMGAEIGISTDRIHARGPMALRELTTYKYVVRGRGQTRE